MPLHFAYGSNMDRAAMAARCPGAQPLGPARLADHHFFIMVEGYASLRRESGAAVHGVLWDLAPADVPALDDYEEVGAGLYRRLWLAVEAGDGSMSALAYQGVSRAAGTPRPGYMEGVVAAAEAFGLSPRYRAELRGWLPRPG